MPYENEHAARIKDPDSFRKDTFRRKTIETGIDIIIGKLKSGGDSMVTQAYRFNVKNFTADEARKWLKDHNIKYISFEPAKKMENHFEFRYTKNLINEDDNKKADMLLFGAIGADINGNYFANELKHIALNLGIKDVTILINSVGGSVFEGYSILAVMQLLKEKGIRVKTKNVGVAYSMAGIIAGCGTRGGRKIYDYATSMIHSPALADNENATEDVKDGVAKIKNSLVTILASNTNLDKATILEMMEKDTFLTAKETINAGMADEIEKTNNKINNTLSPIEKMAACAKVFNEPEEKEIINVNFERMKKINAILNLNAEASEEAQAKAIEDLQAQAKQAVELQSKLKTAENKVTALTEENKTLKIESGKTKAEAMVTAAITEGKISAEAKETWINNAATDFEGTKALIDSLKVVPGSINNQLEGDPKGEKALADKYQRMLVEDNFKELDALTKDEEAKMVNAWEKHYKPEVEVTE